MTEITKVKSNAEAACNMCTRAALLHATEDPVLFPSSGSQIDCKSGTTYKGKISGDGRAKYIIDDLANYKDNDLKEYFVEIEKDTDESFSDFWKRLQDMADKGDVIIGAYKTNHVFMLVPGGLWKTVSNDEHRIIKDGKKQNGIQEIYLKDPNFDQGDTWGYSFAGNYNYVPRILECGKYVKSANAPAYATMDRRGFSNVKFYKYIKK